MQTLDIVYDEKGDLDRESFLVEVQDGQKVVTQILPRLVWAAEELILVEPVPEQFCISEGEY